MCSEFRNNKISCDASCVSNIEKLGNTVVMRPIKFNSLDGKLVKFIQKRSLKFAIAISIIRFCGLINGNTYDRSLNTVKTGVHSMHRLKGWRPRNLFRTSFDEVLLLIGQ